ncbi:MAG: methyltransferase domain-containing protein, partial [bacterium]|nr:methyltransferase domain-containing protein [bacterium]
LRGSLPIWNLNSLAEHFLELILKHRPAIEASIRQTVQDREELRQDLANVPSIEKVWPSGGNFLLVSLQCSRTSAKELAGQLLTEHGILVKDVSERFGGEGAWWRLAVRTPDDNRRLVAALQKLGGSRQQDWARIWANKKLAAGQPVTLARLLSLSGYDNFGGFAEPEWLSHVDRQMKQLQVQPPDSVFEVGCGAGAFLYPWHQRGHRVAGIDYSANLVAAARAAMPGGDFRVGDASALDPHLEYDIVVSHGVFMYFPDLEYAAGILRKMVEKARKKVAVLEIPDLAKQDQALASRRENLGEE